MSLLNIEMIKASGSYVGKPVKKEITWEVGSKSFSADVYVKLSSYETTMSELANSNSGGNMMVSRIVSSIVDDNGVPIFTLETVEGNPETGEGKMCASLFVALVSAINQANGYSDEKNEEVDGKK